MEFATIRSLSRQKTKLLPKDYAALAQQAGVTVNNISYALNRLIVNFEINVKQVTDKVEQSKIKPHLAMIRTEFSPSAGLKNIKKVLQEELNLTVEYNQLLIALRA